MVWLRRIAAIAIATIFLLLFGGGLLGLTGAISLPDSPPGISKTDADALAAPFSDLLAKRDDVLKSRFVDGVDLGNAEMEFAKMRAAVPADAPKSSRLTRWLANYGPNGTSLTGVHEKEYTEQIVRVETVLFRATEHMPWKLAGFHVRSATKGQLAVNRFSLAGRTPAVTAAVIATFVVLLFVGLTAIACVLMENVRFRWIWLPFVVVGFAVLRVDLNGGWGFQPLFLQLFSAGYSWSGSAFEPWVFSISAPVGAIAFWIKRLRQKAELGPQEVF